MKKRHYIFMLPLAFFLFVAIQLYINERKAVADIVSHDFKRELPYMYDSILYIEDEYMVRGEYTSDHHNYRQQQQRPLTRISATDTVIVAWQYINEPNIYLYEKKIMGFVAFGREETDDVNNIIDDMDSLWNESLKRAQIDAETAIVANWRDVKEMFPTKDSFNVNAPIQSDTSRMIAFSRAFRTDSISISFQNHVSIEGYAVVSPLSIIKRLELPYTIIATIALIYILLLAGIYLYDAIHYRRKYILFMGDTMLHMLDNSIIFADGTSKKLGSNEYAMLRILEREHTTPIGVIEDEVWPDSQSAAKRKNFNVAFSRLSNMLKEINHITLQRDKENIIYTQSTTAKMRVRLYMKFLKLYFANKIE